MNTKRIIGGLTIAGVALGVFAACSQTALPSGKDFGDDKSKLAGDLTPAKIVRQPIDPDLLSVSDLAVGLSQKSFEQYTRYFEFSVSAQADYAEMQICFQSDGVNSGCDAAQRLVRTHHRLRIFPKGNVAVKLRGCVDPSRTTRAGLFCGKWEQIDFAQPVEVNQQVLELMTRREELIAGIGKYKTDIEDTLAAFRENAKECENNAKDRARVAAMRVVVTNFLAMGQTAIYKAMEGGVLAGFQSFGEQLIAQASPAAASLTASATGSAISALSEEELDSLSESLGRAGEVIETTGETEEQVAGGSGLKQASKVLANELVGALPTLGTALFDIFTAKQANRPTVCLAERTANTELAAIRSKLGGIAAEIASIDAQLKTLQGGAP